MSRTAVENIRFTPWRGGQHPTPRLVTNTLEQEGYRPFKSDLQGNYRTGVRSHGYAKVIYCVNGKLEVMLPDSRRRVELQSGDRLDIGQNVRHSVTSGRHGATVIEGTPRRASRR